MTEAEQNRLIIDHMDSLVPALAAGYRGGEVEYDELVAAGREGLIKAARSWDPTKSKFSTWATTKINSELMHATRAKAEPGGDSIEKIYEWDAWGNMGNARAIYDLWDNLDASPEDLSVLFDEIKEKQVKFSAAFISLTVAQRKLVTWVFLTNPRKSMAQAARELGCSYRQSVTILEKALKKMRSVIERMESNTNSGGNIANRRPLSTGRYGLVSGSNAA